jgi:hypothetical protein
MEPLVTGCSCDNLKKLNDDIASLNQNTIIINLKYLSKLSMLLYEDIFNAPIPDGCCTKT